jgi:hypothetical protein
MKRHRAILSCALLGGLALNAFASMLIVTKDHRSFLADEIVSESATEIVFVENRSGNKMAIHPEKVDVKLPRIVRGEKYTEATCTNNAEIIKQAIKRHPKLKKQLISLHNEWSSFNTVDKSIPVEIDKVMSEFRSGSKDSRGYGQAMYSLQMMKYKDPGGHFDKENLAAEKEILNTFLGMDLMAMEERANAEAIKLEEFQEIKKECEPCLQKDLPDPLRDRVIKARETARATTINGYIEYAKNLFKTKPHPDALIAARSILRKVTNEVVEADAHKKRMAEHDAELLESARAKLSDFRIDEKGFPKTAKDLKMEADNKEWCSTIDLDGVDVVEDCYVIPVLRPVVKDITSFVRTTYMLVFSYGPLGQKDYNVMVIASDGSKEVSQQFPVPPFKIGSAHAVARMNIDLKGLPAGAVPLKDENGEEHIKAYMMSRDKGSSEWTVISRAFKIPLGIPEI